jgi:hypothetical protein
VVCNQIVKSAERAACNFADSTAMVRCIKAATKENERSSREDGLRAAKSDFPHLILFILLIPSPNNAPTWKATFRAAGAPASPLPENPVYPVFEFYFTTMLVNGAT